MNVDGTMAEAAAHSGEEGLDKDSLVASGAAIVDGQFVAQGDCLVMERILSLDSWEDHKRDNGYASQEHMRKSVDLCAHPVSGWSLNLGQAGGQDRGVGH